MERYDLGNGIAHYVIEIYMGRGEFEKVCIHRVVKERRPYRPVHTNGDIYMGHGASNGFEAIFLTAGGEVIDAETSSPYFLATNNIDVWGIDLAN